MKYQTIIRNNETTIGPVPMSLGNEEKKQNGSPIGELYS